MGFKEKAKMEQTYIKMSLYGRPGSGKTFTALLFAEGLAKREQKRIAYIDTEHGTDFYAKAIPRKIHPEAFEFYPEHTRSLYTCLDLIKNFNINEFGVLVVDSISHLWEAAKLAYEHKNGKMTKKEGVPIWAWGTIKKPYKEFVSILMNLQCHVIICGRENLDMEETEGQKILFAPKMNAEKDTPHETPFLINMKHLRFPNPVTNVEKGDIVAFWEKDRSGLYEGKSIQFPSYLTIQPIVDILTTGGHPRIKTQQEIQEEDGAQFEDDPKKDSNSSSKDFVFFVKQIQSSINIKELEFIWNKIKLHLSSLTLKDRQALTAIKNETKKKFDPHIHNKYNIDIPDVISADEINRLPPDWH